MSNRSGMPGVKRFRTCGVQCYVIQLRRKVSVRLLDMRPIHLVSAVSLRNNRCMSEQPCLNPFPRHCGLLRKTAIL